MPLPSCFENLCPQFFDFRNLVSKKITSPGKSQETKNFPRFHSCESIDADTYAVYTAGDNANQRAMLLYSHSQLPDALPVSLQLHFKVFK